MREGGRKSFSYLFRICERVNYVKETGFTHVEFMPIWNIRMIRQVINSYYFAQLPFWESTGIYVLN
jgi:pullulanase/glycogen debranching enzyme